MNVSEDVLALPYSSGTTGLPKGVMLTTSNLVSNICQITRGDNMCVCNTIYSLLLLWYIYIYYCTRILFIHYHGYVYIYISVPVMFLFCRLSVSFFSSLHLWYCHTLILLHSIEQLVQAIVFGYNNKYIYNNHYNE